MGDERYVFKLGDKVFFKGLVGVVYLTEPDMTAIKIENVCPEDELKDKFLEFDKHGYRYKWQKEPDLILVKRNNARK